MDTQSPILNVEEDDARRHIVREAQFHSLFTHSLDAILLGTPAGQILAANPVACQLFGYTEAELRRIGRDALHDLSDPRFAALHAERRRTGQARGVLTLVRKDGSKFPAEVSSTIFTDAMGNEQTAILVRDITERQQAEVERAQLLAALQCANNELQHFASMVSHDLQEPLRTVAGYIQLLARRYQGKLDTKADEYIAQAVDGAQRMQQMITDLLAYARVGEQATAFTAVECEELLARVLRDLQLTIADSGAVITHDPLPILRGNATQLYQVFQNLIGNALKFRGAAVPRVHIAARREGTGWAFSIRDNGSGIDPKHTGRLFQVFQRAHSGTEYPGTGMGLAICKKIVERHGGRIWVESVPGRGTTFFFTLPGALAQESPHPGEESAEGKE